MEWSFGNVMWTLFTLWIWVAFIWMFVTAFIDIFRREDLSGGGKALWVALLVIFPLVGTLIYIASRPSGSPQDRRPMTGLDQPRMPIH